MINRMRGISIILALALAATLVAIPAAAEGYNSSFSAEYPSARAYAMGGAYTAVAGDISALQYNPAGLGRSFVELTVGLDSSNADLLSDISRIDEALEEVEQLDINGLAGFSLGSLGLGAFVNGLAMKDEDTGDGTVYYSGRISAGIGGQVLNLGLLRLRFGLSADRLVEGLTTATFDEDGNMVDSQSTQPVSGILLNAGLIAEGGPLSVGISARNVYGTVKMETALGTEKIKPDMVIRYGAALKLPVLGLVLAADMEEDGTTHIGAEAGLLIFKFRVGQVKRPDVDEPLTTAGLGIYLGPLRLDMAAGSTDMFKSNINTAMIQGSFKF
ncbi:MAG TPA: hypothetical protein GXX29_10785 [Firmicutes bacterium]|nr:hypothetical protein [Bacillota bacterium]